MKSIFYLLCALLFVGCVDKEMNLEELEGNIGINADNLIVPLGSLKQTTLGDLIGDDLKDFTADSQTGDYSLRFNGDDESFTIKGADNNFVIPAAKFDFSVDYPAFKLDNCGTSISETFYVGGKFNGLSLALGQTITIRQELVDLMGNITGAQDGKMGYALDVEVPKYVERIDRVYVKHDPSLPGAPIQAIFDLGSIASISDGGTVSVELVVPEGYELYGEDFKPIEGNVFSVKDRKFTAVDHRIAFTAYIGSIINHENAEAGVIHLPSELEYHVSYSLKPAAGTVTFSEEPTLTVSADFMCEDAEVTLNAMDLTPANNHFDNKVVINAPVDAIKSVKHIDFNQANVNFQVSGMEWLQDYLEDIIVEVNLPDNFELSVSSGVNFDATTNTIKTDMEQLHKGIVMGLSSVNFGQGISPDSEGNIAADLSYELYVGLKQGALIKLSNLVHDGSVELKAGYDEINVEVISLTGRADYKHNEKIALDLKDLDLGVDIDIAGLGISPVIDFSLSNPLTLPLYASATITPKRDEAVAEVIEVEPFEILPAQGVNLPVTTNVRIGKNLEPEQGITVVNCDIDKLFNGSIPKSVEINVAVQTDAEKDVTLMLAPEYPLTYGYSFFLPLSFDKNLNLTISDKLVDIDLSETLEDMEISVDGSLSLLCEITNTTPFNLELSVELLDKAGKKTPIQIESDGKNVIRGSLDGKTPVTSQVVLGITLDGSNNVSEQLTVINQLQYTLKATSAADGVSLNKDQAVSGNFKLQFNGNVNVDLFE